MESLIDYMEQMHIKHEFIIDNSQSSKDHKIVTKVKLSFLAIWSLFRCVPKQTYYGKLRYEWVISDNYGNTYSIFDWENEKSLLKKKEWFIGSSTSDEIYVAEFLNTLCRALEVYNKFYKIPIENKSFQSDDPEINEYLKEIKQSLYENKVLLMHWK